MFVAVTLFPKLRIRWGQKAAIKSTVSISQNECSPGSCPPSKYMVSRATLALLHGVSKYLMLPG